MSLASVNTPEALLEALQAQHSRVPLRLGRESRAAVVGGVIDPFVQHWLVPGGVVEFSTKPGAGAWSLCFLLAAAARRRARTTKSPQWLGALDPYATLSAMALSHLLHDVDDPNKLVETLVVRPTEETLLKTATRMTRSHALCALVIDAAGADDLSGYILGVRRLTLAAEDSGCAVLLLTSRSARRAQPLPVAARADIDVDGDGATIVRPLRHRYGMPPQLAISRRRLELSVTGHLVREASAGGSSGVSLASEPSSAIGPEKTATQDRL